MNKRFAAVLVLGALVLSIFAGCTASSPATTTASETASSTTVTNEKTTMPESTVETSSTASATEATKTPTVTPTETPVPEPEEAIGYGVYHLVSANGDKFCSTKTARFVANYTGGEAYDRFTIHQKSSSKTDKNVYAIYKGPDEQECLGLFVRGADSKLSVTGEKYNTTDNSLWQFEPAGEGYYRIVSVGTLSFETRKCLQLKDGVGSFEEVDENEESQKFKLEPAVSEIYYEYPSQKGNIVVRVPKEFIDQKKLTGATHETMKNYAENMQEAYEAEVELTGYTPYDIIIIECSYSQKFVAGVVNNYNFIKADKSFMESEFKKMVVREKRFKIDDICFSMMHELGHMFDSGRAWCFESEAWTDLKLCYVLYKMTLDHKETDGRVFGCSPSDYGDRYCHTYEQMAECYSIHDAKGSMTTEYAFYGGAKLFVQMTYEFDDWKGFGWEPFIKTFHYYQENGLTQSDFDENGKFNNWASFTDFVAKLSEFSGKDIKAEYLTDENWECFRKYYQHETSVAL